jgi:P-type Cu2+ transporter
MSIHIYHVPGIHCGGCAKTIEHALEKLQLKHCIIHVDAETKKLTLKFEETIDDDALDALIIPILKENGFDIAKPHAFWGAVGLSAGFFLLLIPLFFTSIPFALVTLLTLSSIALTIALGWDFYRAAYRDLWQGIWTMDTLFSISTAMILGVSLAALFFPALPMMFETGLLIFGFRHAGIAIADAFKAKLLRVRRFQDDAPKTVMLQNAKIIALDAVKPGDRLRVSIDDLLAVDGVFESGSGMVSNLYQTGSYHSEPLVLGKVYPAGTTLVSISEPLVFCVTATANDSFLARQDRAILDAKLKRASEKKKASGVAYWLQYFVPFVVGVAATSGLVVGVYFGSWILAMQCAVCVLVSACPCTLGLIVPLVTHIGIKKAEKTGIYFREPEQLKMLNKIKRVMIDLNGTFTDGVSKVLHPEENKDLLALMAHFEQHEAHWAAKAIKTAAKDLKLPTQQGACKRLKSTHNGVEILFEGDHYLIGNRDMLADIPDLPDIKLGIGQTVVYLSKNGKFHGQLILEDKIRAGAYDVVRELNAMGKEVYLCTGTDKATADYYARVLKIPEAHVFSNCTIKDKLSALADLKKNGDEVAMLGDSVNDAEVIAASDFGLAVEHDGGHVGVQQGASAVLRTASLLPVIQLFKIADKTTAQIHQNIGFNCIYNAVFMLAPVALSVGAGVILSPAIGAASMILQTLLLFANVYRFDRQEDEAPSPTTREKSAGEATSEFTNRKTYPYKPTVNFKSEPYPATLELEELEELEESEVISSCPSAAA